MQRCDTPLLLAATDRAIDLAEARGWSAATVAGVFYGLKAVLDGHAATARSFCRRSASGRGHAATAQPPGSPKSSPNWGLLHDDTTTAIRSWVDRRTSELPAGFRSGIRAWLVVLLDGDARTRPRSPTTLRVHFGILRSFIERWAATRGRLREITSGDVDTVLEPLRGHRRYNAVTALRSLFRFARRHGLTFADPTGTSAAAGAPSAPCCRSPQDRSGPSSRRLSLPPSA